MKRREFITLLGGALSVFLCISGVGARRILRGRPR